MSTKNRDFPEKTEGCVEEALRGWKGSNAAGMVAVVQGDITSSITDYVIGAARAAGKIDKVRMALMNTGADGTDALSMVVDVKKNGTSIFDSGTTKPTLSKASADYANDAVQLTDGTDTIDFVAGDVFTFDTTLTRTTPEDEMAGLIVSLEMY